MYNNLEDHSIRSLIIGEDRVIHKFYTRLTLSSAGAYARYVLQRGQQYLVQITSGIIVPECLKTVDSQQNFRLFVFDATNPETIEAVNQKFTELQQYGTKGFLTYNIGREVNPHVNLLHNHPYIDVDQNFDRDSIYANIVREFSAQIGGACTIL